MKRREFLQSSLLIAGLSAVVGKAAGLFNEAAAAVTWPKPGMLGYKEVAPADKVKAGKQCNTCKYYKADAAGGAGSGLCTLPAMKGNHVKDGAFCNMWMKKA